MANWEIEAKRQAAECGELKIALTERLEAVNKRIRERKETISSKGGEDGIDAALVRGMCDILLKDLENEAKWLRQTLRLSEDDE